MYGSAIELFNVLLKILTGVGALPGARGAGDVEYLSLLGCIGYLLELAVVGYIERSKLLNETVLVFVVGVACEVVRYADDHPVVSSAFYPGEGSSDLIEVKHYIQYEK